MPAQDYNVSECPTVVTDDAVHARVCCTSTVVREHDVMVIRINETDCPVRVIELPLSLIRATLAVTGTKL